MSLKRMANLPENVARYMSSSSVHLYGVDVAHRQLSDLTRLQ